MKKILLAASEAVPFIKTGGLADVIGSLPKHFPKEDCDIRVIIPKYACIKEELLLNATKIGECEVELNWRKQYAGIYQIEYDQITYYLIENEYYFAGPAPYDHIYLDAEKFAFYSKAVLTVLETIDFWPDIIHCNDWQTGLVPVFLHAQFQSDIRYQTIKTVFTIHNMRFQGRWFIDAVKDITGLDQSYFGMDQLESYGKSNYLKGGIVFSDYITTVSESYVDEIKDPAGGEGLDGLMRMKSPQLFGIINGIDYEEYNPQTDSALPFHFTEKTMLKNKKKNKLALQEEVGLEQTAEAFLIGIVSRLTDQKGMDLIKEKLEQLLSDSRIQLILLGTGDAEYENFFRYIQHKYKGRVFASLEYSESFAHRIYGSADALLMPSMFEPCGLSQLMSMRYGTIPMVRETGGLKDTVQPYNEYEQTGTGFSFALYQADDMYAMLQYAKTTYFESRGAWNAMAVRCMKQDFSWEKAAEKYNRLYDQLIEIRELERLAAEKAAQQALAAQAEAAKKEAYARRVATRKANAARKKALEEEAAKKETAAKKRKTAKSESANQKQATVKSKSAAKKQDAAKGKIVEKKAVTVKKQDSVKKRNTATPNDGNKKRQ